jgi:hypothetical protein
MILLVKGNSRLSHHAQAQDVLFPLNQLFANSTRFTHRVQSAVVDFSKCIGIPRPQTRCDSEDVNRMKTYELEVI